LNTLDATAIIAALLLGPILLAPLERNLEPYCLVLGVLAATIKGQGGWPLVFRAVTAPLPITTAVIAAGLLFGMLRGVIDKTFAKMRGMLPRPMLAALTIVVVGLLSSLITAVVAALMLVEGVGLMGLGPLERTRVVVLGCFAIGLGSALTPIGGPLATLAASAMNLNFAGLFEMLSPWVFPGIAAIGVVAVYWARGPYDLIGRGETVHQGPRQAVVDGIRLFAFIAGLILIGDACAPVAADYLGKLPNGALFWANMVSAALDNSTLVAIEFHKIEPARAQTALLSLLISGGMLIPGNVPNIVCAGKLNMRSSEWARAGLPLGLALLGIYFAVLVLHS
jgi:predicted cation transporter